jgi:hypothetical protein
VYFLNPKVLKKERKKKKTEQKKKSMQTGTLKAAGNFKMYGTNFKVELHDQYFFPSKVARKF